MNKIYSNVITVSENIFQIFLHLLLISYLKLNTLPHNIHQEKKKKKGKTLHLRFHLLDTVFVPTAINEAMPQASKSSDIQFNTAWFLCNMSAVIQLQILLLQTLSSTCALNLMYACFFLQNMNHKASGSCSKNDVIS